MKAHFGPAQPGAYSLSTMTSKHKATSNRLGVSHIDTLAHAHFHTNLINTQAQFLAFQCTPDLWDLWDLWDKIIKLFRPQ